ncbi:hypothetical protein ACFL5H_01980 [Candidatus Latescibacterota bacterium]
MHPAWVLIKAKLRMLAVLLFDTRKQYLIRNIVMLIMLGGMVYASYLFFHHLIFGYVSAIEDIGILLIDRLVAIGFMIFFFLLIISSLVISLGSLYRSRETEYLFSTPLSIPLLFTGKFIDILVFSSWTILVMALPILYAYARTRDFGTFDYAVAGVVILLPFVLIAASIGTTIAILLRYLSKRANLSVLIATGVALFSLILYLIISFSRPTQFQIQFTEDFRALNLFINNFNLNANPFVPNYWFIQGLGALVTRSTGDFAMFAAALITSAFLSLSFLYVIVEKFYYKTWLSSLEQRQITRSGDETTRHVHHSGLFKPSRSQKRALLNKDILIFLREPTQWSQLLIILVLLVLYFINLYFIPGDIDIEQWRTILFLMNFGICGLILATLAVRFVFPSISLEGDSFWVLGSSPVSTATLFMEKFISSFVTFFIIAETVSIISVWFLALEDLYRVLTFGGIFLMSISLSSLAVGFGAAFPDFSERNPSKIVSSPGGILTIAVSLTYVAIMIFLTAVPVYRYTIYLVASGSFPRNELIVSVLAAIILNALTIALPLRLGANAFTRKEF